MRERWLIPVLVLAGLLATLTAPAASAGDDPGGESWLATPNFEAIGGLGQLMIVDAEPGDVVSVGRWMAIDDELSIDRVGWAVVDDLGSAMLRELPEGTYVVGTGRTVDWDVGVGDPTGPPPDQSFYDGQTLVDGFQYIETRDGTLLGAHVVLPGPIEDGPYPTVVEYSGYDPSNPASGGPAQPGSLIASALGYAIVGINVRGTGCSGGAYDFFEWPQVTDGYDVVEAVAAQDWVLHNHVGMVGLSYPGVTQLFVSQARPPSLAAVTPLSVYADTATGVLAPGGILNVGFAVSWAETVLRNAEPYPESPGWITDLIDGGDETCAANHRLRLQNVDAVAKARANPFYTEPIAGPLDARNFVGDINVPVFLASGFQDEQTGPSYGDLLGGFDSSPSVRVITYNGLHADGFAPQVIAEWAAFLDLYVAERVPSIEPGFRFLVPGLTSGIYGGPVALPPDRWGDVNTLDEARARWESEPEIRILLDNGAGADPGVPVAAWETSTDVWPLADTVATRWYLGADGTLGAETTDGPGTGVEVHTDPAVGLTDFYDGGGIWNKDQTWNWVPQAEGDNARFETGPLTEDLVMIGTASVDLHIRSEATDAELEAVISEIRPDGNEMRVQAGQLQVSYRTLDGSSTELQPVQYGREGVPLVPGEWTEARIQIPLFGHTFRAGSAIRLEINTPGGDTAEWQFELDFGDPEPAHVIGTGVDHPSSVVLPVIEGLAPPNSLPGCHLRGQPCRPVPPIANIVVSDAPPTSINTDRPAEVRYPSDYDPTNEYPLVVLLHGFGANAAIQSLYLGLNPQVDERDFVMVLPEGTTNDNGDQFWNAIPKCCGSTSGIDDVAYVSSLIAEARETYSIDESRVYLIGHSNGGMMSFTMACEASTEITAIMSLAGTSFDTAEECAPTSEPVSVLQIHGDADATVNYGEPANEFDTPGAATVRDRHAGFLGCDVAAVAVGEPLDLDGSIEGAETTVERLETGCVDATSVELWTIVGGAHVPFPLTQDFAPSVLDWLFTKQK